MESAREAANQRLLQAAFKGDVDGVNHALRDEADIESRTQHGYTALMEASRSGYGLYAVGALIAKKANIEATNDEGDTALLIAALHGRDANVHTLIEARANVNALNHKDETPLMWAARWGHVHIVNALIAAGADVNAASKDGETALMRAARFGQRSVVYALLDANADVSAISHYRATAWSLAGPETRARLTAYDRWETANPEAMDFSRALNALLGQKSGYQFEADTQGDFRLSVGAPTGCPATKGRDALIRLDLVAVKGDNVVAFAGHVAEQLRAMFREMKGIKVDFNAAQPDRATIVLRHPTKEFGRFEMWQLGPVLHDWLQDEYANIKMLLPECRVANDSVDYMDHSKHIRRVVAERMANGASFYRV